MDDRKWLRRGVLPFPGPLDDWPAGRADWLEVVMDLEEQVQAAAEHQAKADAEYEQWKAARKK